MKGARNRTIWLTAFFVVAACGCTAPTDDEMNKAMIEELSSSVPEWSSEQYKDAINALFVGELAEPVGDASVENVARGTHLPGEIALIDQGKYFIPRTPLGKTEQDKVNSTKLYFIAVASFIGDGNYRYFLDTLVERNDTLPPVKGDLAMYRISRELFPELYLSTNGVPMQFWNEMGEGKNPVYRLIAIQGAISSTLPKYSKFHNLNGKSIDPRVQYWSAEEKIQFYQQFLEALYVDC